MRHQNMTEASSGFSMESENYLIRYLSYLMFFLCFVFFGASVVCYYIANQLKLNDEYLIFKKDTMAPIFSKLHIDVDALLKS